MRDEPDVIKLKPEVGIRRERLVGLCLELGTTIFLAMILVLVALTSEKLYVRFDLTESKTFSLSEESVNVSRMLKEDVKIVAFFSTEHERRDRVSSLLKLFAAESKHIGVEFVDPERTPSRTKRYGRISSGTLVVESADRWEKVENPDEASILAVLLRITNKRARAVYFTQGHGEKDLDDIEARGLRQAKDVMEAQGYQCLPIHLTIVNNVPDDAAVAVIAGPSKDFLESELRLLSEYLRRGGALLILLDPQEVPRLRMFFEQLGLVVKDDVIVDKKSRLFGNDVLMPVVTTYNKEHEITANLGSISFFPIVRSVRISERNEGDFEFVPLAYTSAESWAKTDLYSVFTREAVDFDNLKDDKGPICIAVAGQIGYKDSETGNYAYARIVFFGDSDFASNVYFGYGANGDLFVNSIHWLAEHGERVAARPLSHQFSPIILTPEQAKGIFLVSVLAIPVVVLLIGFIVLWRSRWKS